MPPKIAAKMNQIMCIDEVTDDEGTQKKIEYSNRNLKQQQQHINTQISVLYRKMRDKTLIF